MHTLTVEGVTAASSAGVLCTPEHLFQHSDSHIRDLGDLVESIVYTDGTRSKVVRINVKETLDRDRIVQLWGTLDYILKHPTEVGFQCKAEPGLLQIESIDLLSLQPISQDLPPVNKQFMMDCYPLYKILELATVRVFGVTVQADEVLHNLMYLLNKFGSLRELTIKNINNVSLLSRLESVFQRHRYLSKLSLAAFLGLQKKLYQGIQLLEKDESHIFIHKV